MSETKRIEAMFGPMAGWIMDIDPADADAAIADGWGRDPHVLPDPEAPLQEFDPVAHDQVIAAAEAAAKKLRGEEEQEPPVMRARNKKSSNKDDDKATAKKDEAKTAEPKTTAMQAEDQSDRGYETRTARRPKAE